ncbi:MAG: integrase core domain-containing protein [Planctomycetota bacterium]|jgi:transposase InsO family protein
MPTLTAVLGLLRAAFRERQRLLLENAALKHQLAVLKRSVKRPRIEDSDRIFWIFLRGKLDEWRDCLHFVQPDTVVRWHRKGWKHYWGRKSKPKQPGRPPISFRLIHLIKRLSRENVLWGAPRIAQELAQLGHDVAASTVAKYMLRHPSPKRQQGWRTFIRNHMPVTAACDSFVVPTLTFKRRFAFVVLSHDRRRILHVGVTKHPTAEWTARQLVEALPGDGTEPRFLIRDRDGIYGDAFRRQARAMDLTEVLTMPRSPWQNAYCERVIGSIRRESTDHIIPLGEKHLLRVLREYAAYYNSSRAHQGLDGDTPEHREPAAVPARDVVAEPVLGGLHHRYRGAA